MSTRFGVAIVTRGSQGVTVAEQGELYVLDIEPMPVVDPTGAGDAFCAGFLENWISTWNVQAAAEAGADLAADAVGVLGGRPSQ
ncbi:MAG: PfkB family carbohydrate kinase [Thermomicrobiales bacterium]